MCGIAGIVFFNNKDYAPSYKQMAQAIQYRGRDGAGSYERDGVFLYHQRLSIIDIDGGAQPLYSPDGVVVIANGEIYNYQDLYQLVPDYPFTSSSDSELLLALYHKYGRHFMQHIRGMVAFALYDPHANILLLGRDPLGIKPLYIYEHKNFIAFSSSLDSFLCDILPKPTLNNEVLRHIYAHQYHGGEATIYDQCKRVRPGSIYCYKKDGQFIHNHIDIFTPLHKANNTYNSDDNVLETLHDILHESIRYHTIADVPIGLFLSGGIDSSAILASLEQAERLPELALSASIDGKDETNYARTLSQYYNIKHEVIPFGAHDMRPLLQQHVTILDDPICDYALFPTLKLASAVPNHIKVILTGEGGDEFFAGYRRYQRINKKNLIGQPSYPWSSFNDAYQYKQMTDIMSYLPDNLLLKTDRALMAYHMEGRVPLCDVNLAAWAYHLPGHYKIHGKHGKYIMQQYLQQQCAIANVFTKKRGFTVPIERWIHTIAHDDKPSMLASNFLAILCSPKQQKKLWSTRSKKASIALFRLWMMHYWYQHRFAA